MTPPSTTSNDGRPDRQSRLAGPGVYLRGIGHYFPGPPVANTYFERFEALAVDDDWIRHHTGVQYRHWPDESVERHVEMGVKAAEAALADAGMAPADIDIIIGTTSTSRPRVNPSSLGNNYMDIGPPLQARLGAARAFVFDVSAVACSGFLYASACAQALIGSLGQRRALVVCAENPKPILNFAYRNSVLFGAGAAAALWERSDADGGLIDVVIHSDGRYFDAFDIDAGDKMVMRGGEVGRVGTRVLTEVATEILDRNQMTPADVDWFIPHQANAVMISQVVENVGIPRERVLLNLPQRGNTSSVGCPSCLSEYVRRGVVRPGELLLTVSIGRGFSWAAMLFRYGMKEVA